MEAARCRQAHLDHIRLQEAAKPLWTPPLGGRHPRRLAPKYGTLQPLQSDNIYMIQHRQTHQLPLYVMFASQAVPERHPPPARLCHGACGAHPPSRHSLHGQSARRSALPHGRHDRERQVRVNTMKLCYGKRSQGYIQEPIQMCSPVQQFSSTVLGDHVRFLTIQPRKVAWLFDSVQHCSSERLNTV
jgi:hypothetical protein